MAILKVSTASCATNCWRASSSIRRWRRRSSSSAGGGASTPSGRTAPWAIGLRRQKRSSLLRSLRLRLSEASRFLAFQLDQDWGEGQRTLKLASRWANKHELLLKVPEFATPSEAKGSKGRALSLEEFERMLAKSGPLHFCLRGLWALGLRLGESIDLRWDNAPGALVVDFTGRRLMFRILAKSEKGNTHVSCRWRQSSLNCWSRYR